MVAIQTNIRFTCGSSRCNEERHWSDYIPVGATPKEIFDAWKYSLAYSSWRFDEHTQKCYCTEFCQVQDSERK